MANANWIRSAGTVSATVATVVAGIVVNLGILGTNPNSPGELALAARRATPTQPAARQLRPVTSTTAATTTLPTVTISVPPAAQLVEVAPVSTQPTSAPFDPAKGGPPPTPGSTVPPTTTTTPGHRRPPETFSVAGAGTIAAQWTGRSTISITVHTRHGWTVSIVRPSSTRVRVTFSRGEQRIVWRARIVGRKLRVRSRWVH
jgi:hypothetical protein